MKTTLIRFSYLLLAIGSTFCFTATAQTTVKAKAGTANTAKKPITKKAPVKKKPLSPAAVAALEKAKKDSAEAVHALARQLALEYIREDSVKKALLAEEARMKQEKIDEQQRASRPENLTKKEKKEREKEEKAAEAQRKKELKEEEKANKKSEKTTVSGKEQKSAKDSKTIKTYAILPFDVQIEKNLQMKKTTPEMLHEQEQKEAFQYQNGVFQFLMKKKKEYAVNFQDIDDTNTLLSRAGITSENLKSKTKGEICELLKVDGIVNGKFYRKEAMDQSVGKALNVVSRESGGFGAIKTGDADLSLSLYNAAEQRVTWTYKNDDWNGMKDQADITDRLMQKAAKKFPFKK